MAHCELPEDVREDETAARTMGESPAAANTTTPDSKSAEAMTPTNCSPWLPLQLRTPSVSGARGEFKFAFFAGKRRLLVERAGELVLYDCGDHLISGMRIQAGEAQSPVFTSQRTEELQLGALRQLS